MKRYKSFTNVRFFKSFAKHAKINKSRRNKRTKKRLTKRRFRKGG